MLLFTAGKKQDLVTYKQSKYTYQSYVGWKFFLMVSIKTAKVFFISYISYVSKL